MRYRYAFASSSWVDNPSLESIPVLKGVKVTWQDSESIVATQATISSSIPLFKSFSKHPILTVLLNGLAVLSCVAIALHFFIDLKTLHPTILLFIALASGSLSLVLLAAVEDFYGKEERK